MKQRFFICKHCGNLIAMVKDTGVPVVCCGEKMHELIPGTTDASVEKHVPVVKEEAGKVTVEVSSVAHPMTEEHHIAWISLQTDKGVQRKTLDHTGAPKAEFQLAGEKAVKAYAYCNLHGLWASEVK